jgi:tyrosyl-tRNA synthetase
MDLEDKLSILEEGTEEIVTNDELTTLLETNDSPRAYIGLEPSGLMHIGQGVPISEKLKDFTNVGFNVRVLLADWHAFINDKLDGDLENIYTCGKYVKDALVSLGVDESKVEFVFASDLVNDKSYWERVLKASKASTVARIKRAMSIMGRTEEEADLDASKMIYPAMQVADISHMDLDVAYGGMDQRHAHMLYRDISPKLGWKKIVAIHTSEPARWGKDGRRRCQDEQVHAGDVHFPARQARGHREEDQQGVLSGERSSQQSGVGDGQDYRFQEEG